jgi:hypothetical protein
MKGTRTREGTGKNCRGKRKIGYPGKAVAEEAEAFKKIDQGYIGNMVQATATEQN